MRFRIRCSDAICFTVLINPPAFEPVREREIFSSQEEHDEDVKGVLKKWISEKKLFKLKRAWENGCSLDWQGLYGSNSPKRIRLPVYPFSKERFWIKNEASSYSKSTHSNPEVIHPLVHKNTSVFDSQQYASFFSGDESFFRDHKVTLSNGRLTGVLPGVAFFEMARVAFEQASSRKFSAFEITDALWLSPFIPKLSTPINTGFRFGENEKIFFDMYSLKDEGRIVYFEGSIVDGLDEIPKKQDISGLKLKMGAKRVSANDVYKAYSNLGIEYGASHQSISEILCGEKEVLAQIRLPEELAPEFNNYILHPSLLDGVLQATIGLMMVNYELPTQPFVPFSMRSLKVFNQLDSVVYALIKENTPLVRDENSLSCNIDIFDQRGNLCVSMLDFTARKIDTTGSKLKVIDAPMESLISNEKQFDLEFYKNVIDRVLMNDISIETAVELG